MSMILDAIDERTLQDQVSFGDPGSSLQSFSLSDVCRLIVAIFTRCILHLCSKAVH